jgi:hypothetical protein
MNTGQSFSQWGRIVAQAWQDDTFKRRLLLNPMSVLDEFGLDVPAGVQVRVVENTDHLMHLTIPATPPERELSDDDLEKVAGGSMLVYDLAIVFGWSGDQVRQIENAEGPNPKPGGSGRSRPTAAA